MNWIIPMETLSGQPVPYLPWLRGLGVGVKGMTEEQCRRAAAPPDPSGLERLTVVKAVVVHHSATEDGSAADFRVLHRLARGWNDVGYHYVIGNGTRSPDGCIEQGRPDDRRGAHARGANHFSLGVCLVGNFMKTHPTGCQMRSLGVLLNRIMKSRGIPGAGIMLHREVRGSSTECPGKHLTLPVIREAIDRYSDNP